MYMLLRPSTTHWFMRSIDTRAWLSSSRLSKTPTCAGRQEKAGSRIRSQRKPTHESAEKWELHGGDTRKGLVGLRLRASPRAPAKAPHLVPRAVVVLGQHLGIDLVELGEGVGVGVEGLLFGDLLPYVVEVGLQVVLGGLQGLDFSRNHGNLRGKHGQATRRTHVETRTGATRVETRRCNTC